MKHSLKFLTASAIALAAPLALAQSAGTWLARVGATTITPSVTSGNMTAPSFAGTKSDVGAASQVSGGVTYFYTDNVSVDLPLALPFKHKLYGAGALAAAGQIGEVQSLPMTVFLQYRFMDANSQFRPYVGLGATYAYFSNAVGSGALTAMTNPGGPATTLKVDSKEFWNYTFEEMGERDLPAMVDYFLTTSGAPQLTYVGWSQGNTEMFLGAISDEPYKPLGGAPATTVGAFLTAHVTHHIALSPVVYLEHAQSLFIKFLADAGVADLIEVGGWARVRVCACACVRACMCVRAWVCVCACACEYVCALRVGPAFRAVHVLLPGGGGSPLARPDSVVVPVLMTTYGLCCPACTLR